MADPSDSDNELTRAVQDGLERAMPDISGPVEVLATTTTESGETDFEIAASRLIAVDPDDPRLAAVYVAVPVTGHLRLDPDGMPAAELFDVDPEAVVEARAWAQSLLATGSVADVAPTAPTFGPRRQPTHEIAEDEHGRRVLRRRGFALQ
jgi:hypothetical protein